MLFAFAVSSDAAGESTVQKTRKRLIQIETFIPTKID